MVWASFKKHRVTEILLIIRNDLTRTDIVKHAYAMAYVTLFSLIPSLAASFALVSLFTPMFGKHSSLITEMEGFILKNLATGSGTQAIQYLDTFLANTDFQKIGMTGFAGTMVALILLLKEIEMALNRIFEIDQGRPLFIRFIYFWTFLTLGTFMLALSVGTLASNKLVSNYMEASLTLKILGDGVYLGSIFGFFLLLYKIVPNCFVPSKHAVLGAFIATFFLSFAVKFFGLYVAHFTSYQAVYGALSALPIFLFWLYVIWFITLFGALITKRSMEGWNRDDMSVEAIHEHIKDPYFQSLLPFLVLIAIYQAYEKSEGLGALPENIAKDLNISLGPVRRALHLLETADLALPLQKEDRANFARNPYFPRLPAQHISYAELKLRLLGSEDSWLKEVSWTNAHGGYYKSLVKAYLNGETRNLAEDLKS